MSCNAEASCRKEMHPIVVSQKLINLSLELKPSNSLSHYNYR